MNRHDRRAAEASLKKVISVGPDARTRVSLVRDTETGLRHYRVMIDSRARPTRCMHIDVWEREERLEHKIVAAAGALAEEMNEKYKDAFDPDRVAAGALTVYKDLLKILEAQAGQTSDSAAQAT